MIKEIYIVSIVYNIDLTVVLTCVFLAYVHVTAIPQGATHIHVAECNASRNYLGNFMV